MMRYQFDIELRPAARVDQCHRTAVRGSPLVTWGTTAALSNCYHWSITWHQTPPNVDSHAPLTDTGPVCALFGCQRLHLAAADQSNLSRRRGGGAVDERREVDYWSSVSVIRWHRRLATEQKPRDGP
ncbi:hypothetical protein E2C01_012558 [Portunus trituberculatus]|uniref:Uncharacterized protein n=1 Tax=Portunus trituberculatus TaxID=210409 RepID=A0A5B7DF17_PORTR|nr:hypothetical protein [Portunus trituberculatus]